MLLVRPLLLLGDITGLLWAAGLFVGFIALAMLGGIIAVGYQVFVVKARTPDSKAGRLILLVLAAPVILFLLLYLQWHLAM